MENIPPTLHAHEQHEKKLFIRQGTSGDSHSLESQKFHRHIHGVEKE